MDCQLSLNSFGKSRVESIREISGGHNPGFGLKPTTTPVHDSCEKISLAISDEVNNDK